ncbi:hypothetical protein NHQ30_001123 [Ciborinia camelliae]|nr:hypothetical protein NHQ30_001123 [Ciborinia camelliae]
MHVGPGSGSEDRSGLEAAGNESLDIKYGCRWEYESRFIFAKERKAKGTISWNQRIKLERCEFKKLFAVATIGNIKPSLPDNVMKHGQIDDPKNVDVMAASKQTEATIPRSKLAGVGMTTQAQSPRILMDWILEVVAH